MHISEYLGIIIITFISNYPRRGYHNCPLSTVNCPLERSDKQQFFFQLTVAGSLCWGGGLRGEGSVVQGEPGVIEGDVLDILLLDESQEKLG